MRQALVDGHGVLQKLKRRMKSAGCFVSDLHLLAARSSAAKYLEAVRAAAARCRIFVFGGDVFDFRWARTPLKCAAGEAADWLRELAAACPACQFYYLLGNHDYHEAFIERLVELDRDVANLTWNHDCLRLGTKVFLHGDVLGRRVTAESLIERRTRPRRHRIRETWEHQVYDLTVFAGLHKPVPYFIHPTRVVVRKIFRYLQRSGHGPESGVRDVYFGHVHRVLSDYRYRGVRFHSGGASIRGLRFQIVEFDLG